MEENEKQKKIEEYTEEFQKMSEGEGIYFKPQIGENYLIKFLSEPEKGTGKSKSGDEWDTRVFKIKTIDMFGEKSSEYHIWSPAHSDGKNSLWGQLVELIGMVYGSFSGHLIKLSVSNSNPKYKVVYSKFDAVTSEEEESASALV